MKAPHRPAAGSSMKADMPQVIKPTVGRKVWYRPSKHDVVGPVPMMTAGSVVHGTAEPLDATVIAVWGDKMINVLVTDTMGRQFPVLSVTLLQPGDEPARDADGNIIGRYCEWMSYQVGQASAEKQAPAAENETSPDSAAA